MRLFQFDTFYPGYLDYFGKRYPEAFNCSFSRRLELLLLHRFDGVHILEPIYRDDPYARFTVANDHVLQRRWAEEKQFRSHDQTDILLAQIEEHRAEVLYSLDPVLFGSAFIRRLPGCVERTICWRAAPSGGADLSGYDLRVCNFPPFLDEWNRAGWRSAYFSPSHDPVMVPFAANEDRPVDICFVGQYSSLHRKRNELLEHIAGLSNRYRVVLALMHTKWKRLANWPPLNRVPIPIPGLPKELRAVSTPPVFGLELYELLGRSKVAINAAIDMAGAYRGNMRCFEAMGCGACMLSDEGIYPNGVTPGVHFVTYKNAADGLAKGEEILSRADRGRTVGLAASENLEEHFSKAMQWKTFCELISKIA